MEETAQTGEIKLEEGREERKKEDREMDELRSSQNEIENGREQIDKSKRYYY